MSTALVTAKGTGLAKTGSAVRQLASRLERARQSRNERVARADAEYVEACRRALDAVSEASDHIAEPAHDSAGSVDTAAAVASL